MNTNGIYFVKAVTGEDDMILDDLPQISFIGRSNVGKSSVINAIANNTSLARSSSTPGRTQEINYFSYKDEAYLVDLPGYGFAKVSRHTKELIRERVLWYFTGSNIPISLVILIIDAKVGPTIDDLDMLKLLREHHSHILIVANKIDKLTKNEQVNVMHKLSKDLAPHTILPFSATKKIGVEEIRSILHDRITHHE